MFVLLDRSKITTISVKREHSAPGWQKLRDRATARRVLDVPISAIHGDEWLFHDYDASTDRAFNASAGLSTLAQDSKC